MKKSHREKNPHTLCSNYFNSVPGHLVIVCPKLFIQDIGEEGGAINVHVSNTKTIFLPSLCIMTLGTMGGLECCEFHTEYVWQTLFSVCRKRKSIQTRNAYYSIHYGSSGVVHCQPPLFILRGFITLKKDGPQMKVTFFDSERSV